MNLRRLLAKTAFTAAGWLSYIKTYQRTYEIVDFETMEFGTVERRWLPCDTSNRLLTLSMTLDLRHWDHWALNHDECENVPCPECGGRICEDVTPL